MTQAPAAAPARRLNPWRRAVHLALVALGWLLFVWSWRRVTAAGPEIGELRWLLLSAVLVVPGLTLGWVAHNLGIHRRKGPRRSIPAVSTSQARDFHGRRIEADWSTLVTARCVDILVEDDRKRLVVVAAAPGAANAPAPATRRPAQEAA